MTKIKIPYAEAAKIARTIADALQPHCEVFKFAGSLRRKANMVGDIEAVVLPKLVEVEDGLFDTKEIRTQGFCLSVYKLGDVLGDVVDGRHVRVAVGGKFDENKELVSGFKLDLFIPQPCDYGRMMAIRTGPLDYSKRVLAGKWTAMGWCGVADLGLRRKSQCTDFGKDGKHNWKLNSGLSSVTMPPEFPTEEGFYAWLGLDWVEPRYRV